jgi:hypothetical protein
MDLVYIGANFARYCFLGGCMDHTSFHLSWAVDSRLFMI